MRSYVRAVSQSVLLLREEEDGTLIEEEREGGGGGGGGDRVILGVGGVLAFFLACSTKERDGEKNCAYFIFSTYVRFKFYFLRTPPE